MILILLIGFVIGILTSAQLRHKRMRPVRIYSSEQQFRDGLSRMIQPAGEQLVKLEPLIKKYGRESKELQREFRKDFDDVMNRYWEELKPLLTQEQLDRLEEMEKRRKKATRRFRPDSLRIEGDSGARDRDMHRGRGEGSPGDRYSPDSREGSRMRDSSRFRGDSLRMRDSTRFRGDSLRMRDSTRFRGGFPDN